MRRIIKLVVAVIAATLVLLGAPATATAEGGYTATFIRDKNNCFAGTLVIVGIPGNHKVDVSAVWGPPRPYGAFQVDRAKGGPSLTQWRKHIGASQMTYGQLRKGKFTMSLSFRDGPLVSWSAVSIKVPACKRK